MVSSAVLGNRGRRSLTCGLVLVRTMLKLATIHLHTSRSSLPRQVWLNWFKKRFLAGQLSVRESSCFRGWNQTAMSLQVVQCWCCLYVCASEIYYDVHSSCGSRERLAMTYIARAEIRGSCSCQVCTYVCMCSSFRTLSLILGILATTLVLLFLCIDRCKCTVAQIVSRPRSRSCTPAAHGIILSAVI